MIQNGERIVLETLENILKQNVVLIGGYAVNAYVPPRFSIDCDLVVLGGMKKLESLLKNRGFVKTEAGDVLYGNYVRYVREPEKVSFDLLVGSVLDRETGIVFQGELFRKHCRERVTVGRASPIRITMKIADPELLFAMKFVTGRRQDIRDIFMLAGKNMNLTEISAIISEKCKAELIDKRSRSTKRNIQSKSFRDSLHGPYGKIPKERFELCKRNLMKILDMLSK
jgi:hypothetical protein